MIKLLDIILNESATNVIQFDHNETVKALDEIIQTAKIMGANNPVLWRGMNSKHYALHVVGDRGESFRGSNLGSRTILNELGVQYPVFAFLNPKRAQFFGSVTAVVLKQPYKVYQSKEIDDIMTHAQEAIYKYHDTGKQQIGTRNEDEIIFMAKEAAKTYKTLNNFSSLSDNEIIVDAKEYWALHLKTLVKIGGKYMPVKSENADSIKTYGELINILYKFKSYLNWMHNKNG